MVFPKIEELQKEGEAGRQKINQYTRMLTVPLAASEAAGNVCAFKKPGNNCEFKFLKPDFFHNDCGNNAFGLDGRTDYGKRGRKPNFPSYFCSKYFKAPGCFY